ncbi:hypothetical protein Skr01_43110 [Sphaerisporangium krabiense]|uniref:DUF397 domain-containing protein n=1 Tax=Sphaerisporangium krabiense TaxID=763782 RepID=UPI001607FC66|nr:DUF397 domain-containing protein [Sphaerisporangium krabiense]GII64226.1 hypothetical protein Skr01_43110 [Sphaerisporangium krabiense]
MNLPPDDLYTYDLTNATWRKSSASGAEHNCVEVATLPDGSRVFRDSKNPYCLPVRLTATQWVSLRESLRSGEL